MASKKILVNLDLDSNKIQNLATPTADSDGATKKYVDDSVGLDYDGMTKEMTSKDTGVFKIVTWKDSNNKMRKKSTLSGGTAPEFTTRTVTFYDATETLIDTETFTLTYDVDGDLIKEELI